MAIENVQQLLTEQLGKNSIEIFEGAVTGKDFYAVNFPVTSVITAITVANATGESALQTTMPAGTTLFMNITAMTISSGVAIGYTE
ncbi:MAG: hypothetical protein GOVbin2390_27 [Prokaryotic dsDNA virus sp.]|nr:MAG: hypothetical protein GOVbin2390_27 [Prokaryotic dsDNA virus sp.]|tara:strand:+ start:11502 stop:11759 length:258 start_codon:yes stop_codon:yes gene_type:complete